MSVDVSAQFGRPVTLAAVLEGTRRVLGELLHGDPPELVVRDGGPDLSGIMVGQPIPGEGAVFYRVAVPEFEDGVHIMVSDFGEADSDDPEELINHGRHAVVSPNRTSVGVTVATGVALAVARVSDGSFIDEQLQRFPWEMRDPEVVIGRSRLASGEGAFDVRCERYLRQFPGFETWPRDRSGLSWRLSSGS
ncbi:hypothetical protein [Actinoplanes subglobosus]|uniref:Uncharacterized protein n=1 Tax=Actinoplanes subglobosus TaxID=1547892 RepID=A0ABV8J8T6_9ACTN